MFGQHREAPSDGADCPALAVARRSLVTSGRNAVSTAAARLMTAANTYAAPMVQRETITAPTNGPMNSPIRKRAAEGGQGASADRIGMTSVR